MKLFLNAAMALFFMLTAAGCKANKVDIADMKPVTTKTVGDLRIELADATGDLKQGQNDFVVQFRDTRGQPVDVGEVQLGSSMSMPGMTPMSGGSQIMPTGQAGMYRVKSNFGMSGSWHFTLSWGGSHGQGTTSFNSNVR